MHRLSHRVVRVFMRHFGWPRRRVRYLIVVVTYITLLIVLFELSGIIIHFVVLLRLIELIEAIDELGGH